MKIAQLMTKNVQTCRPQDTLEHAARLMWEADIGALPVVDNLGKLIGIVTDRDTCMAAYTKGVPLRDIEVAVAMTNHPVACRPDDTDYGVASLMAKHKIRRVPVVDDTQRPVGIVSLNDLALATARGKDVPATEVAGALAAICEHRATPIHA